MRKLVESAGPYAASGVSLLLALASLLVLPATLLEGRDSSEAARPPASVGDERSVISAGQLGQPPAQKARPKAASTLRTTPRFARDGAATLVRSGFPSIVRSPAGGNPVASRSSQPKRRRSPDRPATPGDEPVQAPPTAQPPGVPTPPPESPPSVPPEAPPSSPPESPPSQDPAPDPEKSPPSGSQTPEPSVPIVAGIGEPQQVEVNEGTSAGDQASAGASSQRSSLWQDARADWTLSSLRSAPVAQFEQIGTAQPGSIVASADCGANVSSVASGLGASDGGAAPSREEDGRGEAGNRQSQEDRGRRHGRG